ncbi:MAG: diguanylate cyclase [Firmicutes bacterium]|nr:diguanylate cyclase [Bacillota bacterium]
MVIMRGRMLMELRNNQEKLMLSKMYEERFRLTIDNAPIGMAIVMTNGRFIHVNHALCEMVGYSPGELLDLTLQDIVHPDDLEADLSLCENLLQGEIPRYQLEKRFTRKDDNIIDVMLSMSVVRDSQGVPVHLIAQFEDITERRKAEEQIRYLSFHDKLTGLYNRAYFEEELDRSSHEQGQMPLSLIMGDVNGLKLVNDIFGHREGDQLLIKIAQILKASCREGDVIARWGGDEFAIILPRTTAKAATEVVAKIRKACNEAGVVPIQPSIALGAATQEEVAEDIQDVLKEAEDRMYRSKLMEGKSIRSSIISSLQRTLAETTHETEEHAWRLQDLALRVGHALGLTDSKLDELVLLAVLHDVGKVAIPDSILMKPGPLSPEEWGIMQKHPEIGYRIAQSSCELAHIAEGILAHHERWDGMGYPRGLRGDEIPLLSRIIAIVDAYDVMTHERPYKAPVSPQEALEELKRCAGGQFDPKLVDIFANVVVSKPACAVTVSA